MTPAHSWSALRPYGAHPETGESGGELFNCQSARIFLLFLGLVIERTETGYRMGLRLVVEWN